MKSVAWHNENHLRQLKWQWLLIAAVWLALFAIAYWWLQDVIRYPILSLLCLSFCLYIFWRGLADNHRDSESHLLPTLGWGNHLTLWRGFAMSLVAGFIFVPRPAGWLAWLPMLLYTFADVADYFDGYLARRTHHATKLGGKLDIEFDGLGMLVVTVLGIWYGMLPLWFLLLGLARPWFILGLIWRQRRDKPIYEMVPSVHRRLFAGVLMGFMSAILWPIIPPAMTHISGTLIGLAVGLGFVRDWLTVSGRLDPTQPTFRYLWQRLGTLCIRWLPLLMRLIVPIAVLLIYRSLDNKLSPTAWADLMASWGMTHTAVWATVLSLIALIGTALTALGFMGRVWALLLVFPIGFDMVTVGLNVVNGLANVAVIYLILLGTSPFSLWRPEEYFMRQRLGDKA
jgi:CDP-diacylglycerol--glycerol-3-phosphate 3-phosphatidyltransferase